MWSIILGASLAGAIHGEGAKQRWDKAANRTFAIFGWHANEAADQATPVMAPEMPACAGLGAADGALQQVLEGVEYPAHVDILVF
jgi:hypothetical protein